MGLPTRSSRSPRAPEPPARPPGGDRKDTPRGVTRDRLLLLLLWLVLALVNAQVLGAYLTRSRLLETPAQVCALALALVTGLSLFAASRPHQHPIGAGIGANLVLLLGFLVLARPTDAVLRQHGDWAVTWQAKREGYTFSFMLAEGVSRLSRWGIGHVARVLPPDLFPGAPAGTETAHRSGSGVASPRSGRSRYGSGEASEKGGSSSPDPDTGWRKEIREKLSRVPDAGEVAAMERQIGGAINHERSQAGLVPVPIQEKLSGVARAHSEAMRDQGFFGLEDAQGRSVAGRAGDAGLGQLELEVLLGEVEGYGDKARDLVKGFMAVEGDRARILNRDEPPGSRYQGMGVGVACGKTTCLATVVLQH